MKRIVYGSLSVLTAVCTVFVAAKAEVFSDNQSSDTSKEEVVFSDADLSALPEGLGTEGLGTEGLGTEGLSTEGLGANPSDAFGSASTKTSSKAALSADAEAVNNALLGANAAKILPSQSSAAKRSPAAMSGSQSVSQAPVSNFSAPSGNLASSASFAALGPSQVSAPSRVAPGNLAQMPQPAAKPAATGAEADTTPAVSPATTAPATTVPATAPTMSVPMVPAGESAPTGPALTGPTESGTSNLDAGSDDLGAEDPSLEDSSLEDSSTEGFGAETEADSVMDDASPADGLTPSSSPANGLPADDMNDDSGLSPAGSASDESDLGVESDGETGIEPEVVPEPDTAPEIDSGLEPDAAPGAIPPADATPFPGTSPGSGTLTPSAPSSPGSVPSEIAPSPSSPSAPSGVTPLPGAPPSSITPGATPGTPDGSLSPVKPISPMEDDAAPVEPLSPIEDDAAPLDAPTSGSESFGSGDRLVGGGFSPFQLSYLAIGGGLEGIPGGEMLLSAYDSGDVSAEDIVSAGAATNRLGTDASNQADYTAGVERFLALLSRDSLSD